MLDKLFIELLNMSYVASIVILFVIMARVLLRKAPKRYSYILWGIPLFRLLCPFSFESAISLIPTKTKPIPTNIVYSNIPRIDTGVTVINNTINPLLGASAPDVGESINPLQVWIFISEMIWVLGLILLILYSIISFIKVKRKLVGAIKLKDNIYLADYIISPFVIGIINPKIYLPSTLDSKEQEYIILHEQTHIIRGDHIMKLIGFLALCLHWFNPMVWIAFFISGKDMEMSCDESVMKNTSEDIRKEYSTSLLRLATGKRVVAGTPLAFGEGDTKKRIKNIISYKKPVVGIIIMVVILVVALSIGLLSNPSSNKYSESDINTSEYLSSLKEPYIGDSPAEAKIFKTLGDTNTRAYTLEQNMASNIGQLIYLTPLSSSSFDYADNNLILENITITEENFVVNGNGVVRVRNCDIASPIYEIQVISDYIDVGLGMQFTDITKYETRTCLKVLNSDNSDSGYRIYYLDDEIWIGYYTMSTKTDTSHCWFIISLTRTDGLS